MSETIKTITSATWPTLKAKAAEMGIAAPANPTTWNKVHSEINGFADRAAAKVQELTPVVAAPPAPAPPVVSPPPAPAPPIVSPPAPTTSAVVMTRALAEDAAEKAKAASYGLADVYALRYTAGAPVGLKKRPERDPLPPCTTFAGRVLTIRPTPGWNPATIISLDDFDLTGLQVDAAGDITVAYRRSLIITDPANPIQPIVTQGAVKTILDACTVSLQTVGSTDVSLRLSGAGVAIRSTRFEHIAVDCFNFDGPGLLDIDGMYCEAPGQQVHAGAHLEPMNISGGTARIRNLFIDGVGAWTDPYPYDAGPSGIAPFWQPRNGPVDGSIDRMLVLPREFRSWQNMEAGDDKFPLDLTITNTVMAMCLRPDGGGYCGPIHWASARPLKGQNNRRWDDGSLLPGMNGGL